MEGRASHCDTKILRENRTSFQFQRPSRQQEITWSEMCQFISTLVPLFLPTVAFYLGPKWPKQSWLSDFFPRVSCLKWCQHQPYKVQKERLSEPAPQNSGSLEETDPRALSVHMETPRRAMAIRIYSDTLSASSFNFKWSLTIQDCHYCLQPATKTSQSVAFRCILLALESPPWTPDRTFWCQRRGSWQSKLSDERRLPLLGWHQIPPALPWALHKLTQIELPIFSVTIHSARPEVQVFQVPAFFMLSFLPCHPWGHMPKIHPAETEEPHMGLPLTWGMQINPAL